MKGCGLFRLFEYNISTSLPPICVSTQMKRCLNVKKERRFIGYSFTSQVFYILLDLLPFTFQVFFYLYTIFKRLLTSEISLKKVITIVCYVYTYKMYLSLKVVTLTARWYHNFNYLHFYWLTHSLGPRWRIVNCLMFVLQRVGSIVISISCTICVCTW